MNRIINVAIMASGRGSNAKAIIDYSKQEDCAFRVKLILSNKKNAGVLDHGADNDIPTFVFNKTEFSENQGILQRLEEEKIDLVVLAGFLWLIPKYLIDAYPRKMLNIHPALLPKYGGKGMYGQHIHKAVHENNEAFSGMTVHFVNEVYDEGGIIFQTQCPLSEMDLPQDIANKVLKLEHFFYPRIIEGVAGRMMR